MSNFWHKTAATAIIVDGSGRPIHCPGCACTICDHCLNNPLEPVGFASSYTFGMSGLVDGSCADCDTISVSGVTLQYDADTDTWIGSTTIACYGEVELIFSLVGGVTVWQISIRPTSDPTPTLYRKGVAVADRDNPVTFTTVEFISGNLGTECNINGISITLAADFNCNQVSECVEAVCGACSDDDISTFFIAGFGSSATVPPGSAGCDSCAVFRTSGSDPFYLYGPSCVWHGLGHLVNVGTEQAPDFQFVNPPSPLACYGCATYQLDYVGGQYIFKVTVDSGTLTWTKASVDACTGATFDFNDLVNTATDYCDLTDVFVTIEPLLICNTTVPTFCGCVDVPTTLYLNKATSTAEPCCFDGAYTLTYDGVSAWLSDEFTCGGHTAYWKLYCFSGDQCGGIILELYCDGSQVGSLSSGICSCSPFSLTFTDYEDAVGTCCNPSFISTVTVVP